MLRWPFIFSKNIQVPHVEQTYHEGVQQNQHYTAKNPLKDEVVITKHKFNIRIQPSLPLEDNFTNMIASLSLLN